MTVTWLHEASTVRRPRVPRLAALLLLTVSATAIAVGCGGGRRDDAAESPPPPPSPAAAVDHGWAVGEGGTILATDDGGRTWRQVPRQRGDLEDVDSFDDVDFVDRLHGWAVGWGDAADGPGVILATSDGGHTWVRQYALPGDEDLDAVDFIDARRGWAAGGGQVLASDDGGLSWRRTEHESLSSLRDLSMRDLPVHLRDVCFIDAQHGCVVGGDGVSAAGPYGILSRTDDAGRSWGLASVAGWTDTLGVGQLGAVAFADATHGCALGESVLTTADGGRTWRDHGERRVGYLSALAVAGDATYWAVGGRGIGTAAFRPVLARSADGGATWLERRLSPRLSRGAAFTDVFFGDPDHGWIAGRDAAGQGLILATRDGGRTWRRQATGTVPPLRSVVFCDVEPAE